MKGRGLHEDAFYFSAFLPFGNPWRTLGWFSTSGSHVFRLARPWYVSNSFRTPLACGACTR